MKKRELDLLNRFQVLASPVFFYDFQMINKNPVMIPSRRIIALLGILICCTQCNNWVEPEPTAISFASSVGSAPEGTPVTVQVSLSSATFTELEVEFEVSFTGTYFYDAEVTTASPLIIPAGERSGNITFTTIDDGVMEPNADTLTLHIVSTNDPEVIIVEDQRSFTHLITDDDDPELPSTGVRVYLTWDAATESFNDADLDLIMNYDDGTSISPLLVSESSTGFEDVGLAGTAPDGDYYFDIRYLQTRNGLQNDVDLALVFAQADGSIFYVNSFLPVSEVGTTTRLVKMTKEETDFTYQLIE